MSSQSSQHDDSESSTMIGSCSVAPPIDQDFDDSSSDLPIIAAVYSLAPDSSKPTLVPKSPVNKSAGGTISSQIDITPSLNGTIPSRNGSPSMASMTSQFKVVKSTPIQCAKSQPQYTLKTQLVAPANKTMLLPYKPSTTVSEPIATTKSYTPIMPKPSSATKILVPVKLPPGAMPVSSNGMVVFNSNQQLLYRLPSGTFIQLTQAPHTSTTSSSVLAKATPTTKILPTVNSDNVNQTMVQNKPILVSTQTGAQSSTVSPKTTVAPTTPRVTGYLTRQARAAEAAKVAELAKAAAEAKAAETAKAAEATKASTAMTITMPPSGSVENPVAYINSVFSKKKMALKVPIEKNNSNSSEMQSQESTASQVMNNLNAHEQRIHKLKQLLKQQEAALEKIRNKRKLDTDHDILEEMDDEEKFKVPRLDSSGNATLTSTSTIVKNTITSQTTSLQTKPTTTSVSMQPSSIQRPQQPLMHKILLPANTILTQAGNKLIPVRQLPSVASVKTVLLQNPTQLLAPNTLQPATLLPATLRPASGRPATLRPATLQTVGRPAVLRPMTLTQGAIKPPVKPRASQIKLSLTPKKSPSKPDQNQPKKFVPSSTDDSFLRLLGLERVVDRLKAVK